VKRLVKPEIYFRADIEEMKIDFEYSEKCCKV
jgi:hypothetical protein